LEFKRSVNFDLFILRSKTFVRKTYLSILEDPLSSEKSKNHARKELTNVMTNPNWPLDSAASGKDELVFESKVKVVHQPHQDRNFQRKGG
jgi:hypothetical protein